MGKVLVKNAIKRKPGYLYYVDGKGNVCEAKMARGGKKKKKKSGDSLEESPDEDYVYEVEAGDVELETNSPADLRKKLKRLCDNARTTIEERGVVTLYITLGAIHWNDDSLGESVSPVVLIPCEFVYKGPNVALKIKMTDDDIRLNPALVYYFREKHKIDCC